MWQYARMNTKESSAATKLPDLNGVPDGEAAETNSRSRVRSVERALEVLEVLGDGGPEGVGLADLGRSVRTSKSTMLTLLRTLIDHGFVAEVGTGRGRRYQLGLSLARLGDRALGQFSLHDEGMTTLRALTDETQWTSRLGVLDDGYAVVIGRIDAPGIIQFQSNLAKHELPHCSALGKAMLSQLPEPAVREIVGRTKLPARTAKTITTLAALEQELARARDRLIAIDDEEDSEGVICIGSPVFDHRGECAAAISVTGLKQTLRSETFELLQTTVRRHAHDLSLRLGHLAKNEEAAG
jgi:IclR family transcriptional regulator, acetate operon repressor